MRLAVFVLALLAAAPAAAQSRWALIVSGASGGEKYASDMAEWRAGLQSALVDRYGFETDHVRVLVDERAEGDRGTAANVRARLGELAKAMEREDLLLVVLFGHGTYDGEVAKFNLVGPDLTAADWAGLLDALRGQVVVVNTTESSFPFLERLSASGRVVITATDSAAQKYATVFPEYFVQAMREASSDLDKNGRTSIFEVISAASQSVRQHYEQAGQLTTERAVFDDNGDGVGREPQAPGPDGAVARQVYLEAENPAAAGNPELAALLRRRRELETEAEQLKLQKDGMPADAWAAEFERLMVELARVSKEIREKS
ncbi:MAG: hypothetical protein AB7O67_01845 [Vicinamibacterales bacterium]